MAFNNSQFDNSESSAAEDREDNLSSEERNVRIFAKQMLQGRLFLGHFQERRRVEPLQAYRDVIIISDTETQLKTDISIVRKRLNGFYKNNHWIGVTEPSFIGAPNGYCFWVESNIDTFGHYWFKIKSIRFRRNEVLLRLKVIRPMTNIDAETNSESNESSLNDTSFEVLLENFKNSVKNNTIWFLSDVLTAQNIKQAMTFISILIVTFITYFIYGIGFFMDFFLKVMREFSIFIQASTPVMIAVVNMIGKIIGGFYILIAMLFRRDSQIPEERMNRRITYPRRQRAIEMPVYRQRAGLTITEVE